MDPASTPPVNGTITVCGVTMTAAQAKLGAALARARGKIEAAKKSEANPFFRSHYADLAALDLVTRGPLSEEGISLSMMPVASGLSCVLAHAEEWRAWTSPVPVLCISKEGSTARTVATPQEWAAALTYARRGVVNAVFNLVAEDDDGETAEGRGAHPASRMPAAAPKPARPAPPPPSPSGIGAAGPPAAPGGATTRTYVMLPAAPPAASTAPMNPGEDLGAPDPDFAIPFGAESDFPPSAPAAPAAAPPAPTGGDITPEMEAEFWELTIQLGIEENAATAKFASYKGLAALLTRGVANMRRAVAAKAGAPAPSAPPAAGAAPAGQEVLSGPVQKVWDRRGDDEPGKIGFVLSVAHEHAGAYHGKPQCACIMQVTEDNEQPQRAALEEALAAGNPVSARGEWKQGKKSGKWSFIVHEVMA